MPSTRLTLIKNSQQNFRTAVLFNPRESDDKIAAILTLAKNKLRIRATRIFVEGGNEISSSDELANVLQNDRKLFISGGEDYIGLLKEHPSAEEAAFTPAPATITNIAYESHVEPDAFAQLKQTAILKGMRYVFGMPDLHPVMPLRLLRKYVPHRCDIRHRRHDLPSIDRCVAANSMRNTFPSLCTCQFIYNRFHNTGDDIGCGMVLYSTRLSVSSFKPQRAAERLRGIEGPWDGPIKEVMERAGVESTEFDATALGTIGNTIGTNILRPPFLHLMSPGGGNHFAELQQFTEILDPDEFVRANLSADRVYLLVHSGSRRLGGSILAAHTAKHGHAGLEPSSPEGQSYLRKHDNACKWARLNREVIARRVMERLNAGDDVVEGGKGKKVEKVLDLWHNNMERKEWGSEGETKKQVWVHRKGAAPSDRGLVMIPGSRGACSYLVMPVGDQKENGYSLAHGAGRKWTRTFALSRQHRCTSQQMRTTSLGSVVICEDEELLYEEQPDAYKEITDIITDLTANRRIAKVVAILSPLLTYKLRKK
ncbi:tRNA-splicing ligase RtcB-domain-containing protein [Jimgerdemannia flammicorona]|uniref:3'-phosphate/5'-hydroxy nucleic acid ligase n=1 Tax=Jimgerdemannia flammicorona TaxID=994334 RepID=A0A433CX60_9FUNG|nr:tRNA-splicing ligase RtcB-domain-containing protein [Jimgerdemannia flammicorona]